MEQIELVIRIPQKLYDTIKKRERMLTSEDFQLYEAVENGTPLPKGHGDLIDRSKLTVTDLSPDPWYSPQWGYSEWEIDDADIIVEADKEGAEE